MIEFRSIGATVAASIFALSAHSARADNYNPYVTVDYLETSTPRKSGDPDRPIVVGSVPNPEWPKGEDKVRDRRKPQDLGDLPAPPRSVAQQARPSPSVNAGLAKFGANIHDQLKRPSGRDITWRAGQGPAAPRGSFHARGHNLMNARR